MLALCTTYVYKLASIYLVEASICAMYIYPHARVFKDSPHARSAHYSKLPLQWAYFKLIIH